MHHLKTPIKLLTVSSLYPNIIIPTHGVFVEQRLRELLHYADGQLESKVLAPVPWFPWSTKRFKQYAQYARIPHVEARYNIRILHPRYLVIPKLGMSIAPLLMAASLLPACRKIIAAGYDFDLIDAHYAYPDGVAATYVAQLLKKPVIVTARGSDINQIPDYFMPRKQIQWMGRHNQGMITVCEDLKGALLALGFSPKHITVLRNGVDLKRFYPVNRKQARQLLNLSKKTLLSIGWLIKRKAHDKVIKALPYLEDMELMIVGSGPEEQKLKQLCRQLKVIERVHFTGNIAQAELKNYYSAADIMVLCSSSEGWANVLLESMACGTPVVASNAGGNAEVVAVAEAGLLLKERTPECIAETVKLLFAQQIQRQQTAQYAQQFTWQDTSQGQINLFQEVIAKYNE